jgi:Domain of unknown function DUF29
MKTTEKTVRANPRRRSIAKPVPKKKELEYDKDFYKWTKTQAGFLKKGNIKDLDIDNLIEEIESLGRSDKRSIYSHTIILLMHLLKLKYQPEKQLDSNSWKTSISNASMEVMFVIKDSPCLKNELFKIYPEAYKDAKKYAAKESGLDIKVFPEECPWTIKELFPDISEKPKKK